MRNSSNVYCGNFQVQVISSKRIFKIDRDSSMYFKYSLGMKNYKKMKFLRMYKISALSETGISISRNRIVDKYLAGHAKKKTNKRHSTKTKRYCVDQLDQRA